MGQLLQEFYWYLLVMTEIGLVTLILEGEDVVLIEWGYLLHTYNLQCF